jgi:DNA polymerase-3 subunit delta
MLVERTGPDLGRLDTELGKLSLAAGKGGEITPELIDELVGRTREEEVWSIQAELLSGDPARTVRHLRAILDHAPRDAHVPVTFACTDLARKLHAASRAIGAGANPFQVGKDLKLWGPSRDAILGLAKRISPDAARSLLEASIAADRAGKTGLGRPERTLERLALRFAGVASGRG